ncbi:MAG: hypothetical protein U5R48_03055 [Gammaproteobacteria bacterium]|nr:hypothetical protein [Gammaproteobacteria bacterium]
MVPANFTDLQFNSREPAADWAMVIEHGGAALGSPEKMPAFREVLTDEEITTPGRVSQGDSGRAPRPGWSAQPVPAAQHHQGVPGGRGGVEEQLRRARRRGRLGERDRVREALRQARPAGWLELVQSLEDGDSDLDKIEVGGKYVLHTDERNTSILTAGSKFEFPVDDGDEEWLPYLAFGRILNDRWTFQGHGRAKLPFDDFGDGSFEVAGIMHWTHSPWPRNLFPGLEVVADIPFDRGNGPDRSDFAAVSIIPQTRIGLTKGGHVALNLGVEIPVNETDRFDYVAQMSLLWDFADGPFWMGW